MAGHFAAMSAFLLRGWNVAVPFVDVGDDVLVVEDEDATIFRVQVKTREGNEKREYSVPIQNSRFGRVAEKKVQYPIPQRQLETAKGVELFYMLMVRWEERWRFILIPRDVLADIREAFVLADRKGKRGRRPTAVSKTGDFGFDVTWTWSGAVGWGADLTPYTDVWPTVFPDVRSRGPSASGAAP